MEGDTCGLHNAGKLVDWSKDTAMVSVTMTPWSNEKIATHLRGGRVRTNQHTLAGQVSKQVAPDHLE